jgi:hypothetical protein
MSFFATNVTSGRYASMSIALAVDAALIALAGRAIASALSIVWVIAASAAFMRRSFKARHLNARLVPRLIAAPIAAKRD